MNLKEKKPINSSQRQTQLLIKNELDSFFLKKKKIGFHKSNGRNNQGKITVPHRGGGHKQLYRFINLNRQESNIHGKVKFIVYDPFRSANLAGILIKKNDFYSEIEYILSPEGLKINDNIKTSPYADFQIGNALPLRNIPIGKLIHNISLFCNKRGQYVRSAGTCAQLLSKVDSKYAKIRLPSKELILVSLNCYATLGTISNINNKIQKFGKAGRLRWLNKRPHVRGVAMNPVDHPHGGGEGKTSGGRPSVTPKGKITKGKPTRKKKRKLVL